MDWSQDNLSIVATPMYYGGSTQNPGIITTKLLLISNYRQAMYHVIGKYVILQFAITKAIVPQSSSANVMLTSLANFVVRALH